MYVCVCVCVCVCDCVDVRFDCAHLFIPLMASACHCYCEVHCGCLLTFQEDPQLTKKIRCVDFFFLFHF